MLLADVSFEVPLAILAFIAVGPLILSIIRVFYGPLARFPGPKLWAFSKIPSQLSVIGGRNHRDMLELHKRYGPIVRIGPTELAFFSADAFRDIYTKRPGHRLPLKHRSSYPLPPNETDNIVTATDEATHARHRRLLGNAFSEKALREQEFILQNYTDTFIKRLREVSHDAREVDIRDYINFVIFDITGDLMFGESFGCLEESKLHPWIELLFGSAKAYSYLMAVHQFPWLRALLERMIPRSVMQQGIDHFNLTAARVDKRLASTTDRPDIITFALRNGLDEGDKRDDEKVGAKTMTRAELHSNAYVMIGAGSEEPATHLVGCIYYLATHISIQSKLRNELRATFSRQSEITIAGTTKLPYLNAVVEESFRIYSPFVTSLPRKVQEGGGIFAGEFVPEGTTVASHLYASFHSLDNFKLPEQFIPERWLNDMRFKDDRREVLHPASLGPRGCIGKALGYAEIRLVLSKLIWNCEVKLSDHSRDWLKQDVFFIWDKPPLMVTLTPV